MTTTPQCSCGRPSHHTTWQQGTTTHQCCQCYVNAGNPPADWHQNCVTTWNLR